MSFSDNSNKNILYRRGDFTKDARNITKLWHDVYQETHASLIPQELLKHRTMDAFRIRVENPKFIKETIVATKTVVNNDRERTECLVGFVTLRIESHEIYQLFVAKEARGLGVAKILLEKAEEDFKASENKRNCHDNFVSLSTGERDKKHLTIHLHASVGNFAAKHFYEKHGWKTIKQEIFQTEIVIDETEKERQVESGKTFHRIEYFPVHCYRLEKILELG